MKKVFLIVVAMLGFSCASNDGGTQGIVNLNVRGCFNQFEDKVQICLDSVFADSRCPTDLVCVWEGDAVAAFTLTKNEKVQRFHLHSNTKFQNDTIIGDIAIKLRHIMPYPISDQPIAPNAYTVEISVDGN